MVQVYGHLSHSSPSLWGVLKHGLKKCKGGRGCLLPALCHLQSGWHQAPWTSIGHRWTALFNPQKLDLAHLDPDSDLAERIFKLSADDLFMLQELQIYSTSKVIHGFKMVFSLRNFFLRSICITCAILMYPRSISSNWKKSQSILHSFPDRCRTRISTPNSLS